MGDVTQKDIMSSMTWVRFFVDLAVVTLVYGGIYIINQMAVKNHLIPRQEELEELMESFKNGDEHNE